ncbi:MULTISPECIES: DNA/RNA nuclease SfsA [Mogibacterium]|uniref:Sugar fermentation stimulation protein homolog n=1 Tax=Mogibacterium kristiansenii TaxID=2606708 RepID=A0A6N7X4Q5_9FIRM|nr:MULTISPECIES: DNA/RNA nuclease SfsA [Mogibacterium]MCI7123673.1 DNA/RNA nuclease SfsA [Mogibacterium sp.]MEE0369099.1 DNA/RNA nuclease SfsA [Clostridia bacterium]MST70617.1 DNA/RNA nuclease SfsA [Mogibacterium kristiansenii]
MRYPDIAEGKFIDRPNRFVAHVEINGHPETVHVKNTGRCRELLLPGSRVILNHSDNPNRKTAYDLVAVYKESLGLVNIDSQAPNQVMKEWLSAQGFDVIHPEYTYGNSRMDFYMERMKAAQNTSERYLLEVKGCTLEKEGIGYFPDAPTLRGVKHLHELIKAAGEGYHAMLAFVISMPKVTKVLPNVETHPEFGEALTEAKAAGVQILELPCKVTEDGLEIRSDAQIR